MTAPDIQHDIVAQDRGGVFFPFQPEEPLLTGGASMYPLLVQISDLSGNEMGFLHAAAVAASMRETVTLGRRIIGAQNP